MRGWAAQLSHIPLGTLSGGLITPTRVALLSALAILILAVAQYLLVPEPWQVLSVLQDGMRTKSPEGLEDAFHKAIKIEKHEGLQDGLRHDLALASMVLSFILFAVLAKASWPRPGSGQGNGHGA